MVLYAVLPEESEITWVKLRLVSLWPSHTFPWIISFNNIEWLLESLNIIMHWRKRNKKIVLKNVNGFLKYYLTNWKSSAHLCSTGIQPLLFSLCLFFTKLISYKVPVQSTSQIPNLLKLFADFYWSIECTFINEMALTWKTWTILGSGQNKCKDHLQELDNETETPGFRAQ